MKKIEKKNKKNSNKKYFPLILLAISLIVVVTILGSNNINQKGPIEKTVSERSPYFSRTCSLIPN